MRAHILDSPSSAEELNKHLTKLSGFRISNSEEGERCSWVRAMGSEDCSSGRVEQCRGKKGCVYEAEPRTGGSEDIHTGREAVGANEKETV